LPLTNNNLKETLDYYRAEIRRLRQVIKDLSPSLEALLRNRGLKLFKKETGDDLLLPDKSYLNSYYRMLHKYSFRLFLRDVIKFQKGFTLMDVARYATPEVTSDYITYLKKIGLIKASKGYFQLIKPVKSFGETLEWFLAEILKREFLMEAFWGVRFKKGSVPPSPEGDYDVIAKFNCSILYVEVKSSPPKQIYQKEIKAFIKRLKSLVPELSIFFMDTELRMKDKIVPMFEEETGTPFQRIKKEIFYGVSNSCENLKKPIFIMNSSDSIINNLETVFSWYHRKLVVTK